MTFFRWNCSVIHEIHYRSFDFNMQMIFIIIIYYFDNLISLIILLIDLYNIFIIEDIEYLQVVGDNEIYILE